MSGEYTVKFNIYEELEGVLATGNLSILQYTAVRTAISELKRMGKLNDALAQKVVDVCKRDHVCKSLGACEGCNNSTAESVLSCTEWRHRGR